MVAKYGAAPSSFAYQAKALADVLHGHKMLLSRSTRVSVTANRLQISGWLFIPYVSPVDDWVETQSGPARR